MPREGDVIRLPFNLMDDLQVGASGGWSGATHALAATSGVVICRDCARFAAERIGRGRR